MICTRCQGTGFLNMEQAPVTIQESTPHYISNWIAEHATDTDIQVCDCCGDGVDWYGVPGHHFEGGSNEAHAYDYNGGLPECN